MPFRVACSAYSMACARCHDHKFDPITQKDYYALMGVFASTHPRRAADVPCRSESRAAVSCGCSGNCSIWPTRSICSVNEGTTFTNGGEKRVEVAESEMEGFKAEATALLEKYPQLFAEPR